MSLFIAIGYDSKTSAPGLVYLGRDGTALQTACATAPFRTIEKFLNPLGIRKNNSAGPANAAAEEAAFQAETDAAQQEYNNAVLAKAEELAGPLRAQAAESASQQARADKAEAALAALRQEIAGHEKAHAAALAQRDAELASLREALKAAKKKPAAPAS